MPGNGDGWLLIEGSIGACSTAELLIAIKHGALELLNCKPGKVATSSA
ncbi:MAG: hypothetical protein ACI9P3_000198 [Bradyrhizobium sp.]|jgi:hypothetical protein